MKPEVKGENWRKVLSWSLYCKCFNTKKSIYDTYAKYTIASQNLTSIINFDIKKWRNKRVVVSTLIIQGIFRCDLSFLQIILCSLAQNYQKSHFESSRPANLLVSNGLLKQIWTQVFLVNLLCTGHLKIWMAFLTLIHKTPLLLACYSSIRALSLVLV